MYSLERLGGANHLIYFVQHYLIFISLFAFSFFFFWGKSLFA